MIIATDDDEADGSVLYQCCMSDNRGLYCVGI